MGAIIKILEAIIEKPKLQISIKIQPIIGFGYTWMQIDDQKIRLLLIGFIWIVWTKGNKFKI